MSASPTVMSVGDAIARISASVRCAVGGAMDFLVHAKLTECDVTGLGGGCGGCLIGRARSRRDPSAHQPRARPAGAGIERGGAWWSMPATTSRRPLRCRSGYSRSTGSHSSHVAELKSGDRSSTATMEGPGRRRQGFDGNQSLAVAAQVDCSAAG